MLMDKSTSPSQPVRPGPFGRPYVHLATLRWLIPLGLLALVVVFEIGPSRWIYNQLGPTAHLVAEIALYGTIGPVLAFLALNFIGRWVEERETSDLQARILAEARELSAANQQLSDDVLQGLFAVSILLASADTPNLPPDSAKNLKEAERTLDQAIRRLRQHLLDHPAKSS